MSGSAPETIPHSWYSSAEIFELECAHIFPRHWWVIGHQDQLAKAGDYYATTLANWPIVITMDPQGELRGFHNVCRHRAGPLMRDGSGRCNGFVCRYHGWRYDSSGNLLKTPGLKADEDIDYSKFSLFPIRVQCWNKMIFVCLDESAPDLLEWLGDIVSIASQYPTNSTMSYLGEVEKNGALNWKAYGDNSCEGYHVGMVHRELGDSVGREKVEIRAYENGEFVGFDVSYTSSAGDQTRDGKGFWIYKFPGLLLHFSEYAFNVESVFPLAADKISLKRWFWVDQEEASARNIDPDKMRVSSEQVMEEDMEICMLVQRNLNTGIYQSGHLSPTEENGTIYFQQLVRAALANHLKETQTNL
jgi:choline monooxygenase